MYHISSQTILFFVAIFCSELFGQSGSLIEKKELDSNSKYLNIQIVDLLTLKPITKLTIKLVSPQHSSPYLVDTLPYPLVKYSINNQYTLTINKTGYDSLVIQWNDAYTPTHLNCYLLKTQMTHNERVTAQKHSASILAHEQLKSDSPFKSISPKKLSKFNFITYMLYFQTNGLLSGELCIINWKYRSI